MANKKAKKLEGLTYLSVAWLGTVWRTDTRKGKKVFVMR
jgi:hypothetical protein